MLRVTTILDCFKIQLLLFSEPFISVKWCRPLLTGKALEVDQQQRGFTASSVTLVSCCQWCTHHSWSTWSACALQCCWVMSRLTQSVVMLLWLVSLLIAACQLVCRACDVIHSVKRSVWTWISLMCIDILLCVVMCRWRLHHQRHHLAGVVCCRV